jgi:hypothetical protein
MCGCTRAGSPCTRPRRCSRNWIMRMPKRVPRWLTKSAVSAAVASLLRCAAQSDTACPGLAPHWHEAQLAAFAENAHLAGQQVLETGKVERREFGQAQAGRVKQLEHCLIAQLQQALAFGFQQATGFIGR